MTLDPVILGRTWQNARAQLLAARGPHGNWEGELASSPLSTATAVFALGLVDEALGGRHRERIARGLAWLVASQNEDGGWGDTDASFSNISTTALAWGTMVSFDHDGQWMHSREQAERWLQRAAGSLAPRDLAHSIAARYGMDLTFSTPILSLLAVAGCLGDERTAWRLVSQLPFELAACPHAWFKWLRLPVVSYALPALIALGHLRHQCRPTPNPLLRVVRMLVTPHALRKLTAIQPASGGFLEATPLTSFVVLSLAASGETSHPVVERGVEFLTRSQRTDGSWPIDTNLATWVTTLSVNSLAAGAEPTEALGEPERTRLLAWLLDQQYQHEHPYTHAAPGGWAWTDLPGGVPDADDTAGALLAIKALGGGADRARLRRAALRGIDWLLGLQNRDGGIPTFCRGWGALEFDRSSPDLTAHAVRAIVAWRTEWDAIRDARYIAALRRMLRYLVRAQRSDGAWSPLWFGNQHAPNDENLTYGTSRVVLAASSIPDELADPAWQAAVVRGCQWLLAAQNEDGGWGGVRDTPSSIEETSLALEALASLNPPPSKGGARGGFFDVTIQPPASALIATKSRSLNPFLRRSGTLHPALNELSPAQWRQALHRGAAWLCQATDEGRSSPPSPIGLYFARLWYYEKLYPLVFSVSALGRLAAVLGADAEPAVGAPSSSMGQQGAAKSFGFSL